MCSGKSAVGRRLATTLELDFVETDGLVESAAGMTIKEIFESHGEEHFRELEHAAVDAATLRDNCVIACGGGVVTVPANIELLRARTIVVWLDVTVDQVVKRLHGQPGTRPLLAGPDPEKRATEMLAARRPLYESVADIRIETSARPPDDLVDKIVRALEDSHGSADK
jgi:shikimate kinase